MALQFILGNSGSGKTTYMYQQVVEEASRNPLKDYLVIVPEQFTMQTQRMLVDLAPNKAIMNIDVLSFKRLAYRVFDDLGIKTDEILEETGKNLVLRKVAQERKEQLTVFRPNMNRMGYISEVKSLLSELVQYNISPEKLNEYIESGKLSAVLSKKLKDVVTMYEGFQEFMKNRYITAEEILYVLKDVAKDSKMLQGSVLVFDEFTGFTPIQNKLLYEIMPLVDKMMVSLTIDSSEDFYHSRGIHELFDMSKRTISSLIKMATELNVEVFDPVVMEGENEKRYKNSPSIAFMEKNIFRRKMSKYETAPEEIQISCLKSPKDEMILVAREINYLIQSENYRYKEIAVVSGAVNKYGNYVEKVFGQYSIPYFLDTTKEILFHPFIEFIRATLEVINKDFSYEAVFRFLRCGFCDIEEKDLDLLENYLLATGIKGRKAWAKKWLRTPRNKELYDLELLENLRIKIFNIIMPVYKVFKNSEANVRDNIIALYEMIANLGVEQQLWDKEKEFLELGAQSKSKEYGQIYEIVMTLFEKYIVLLGDEKLSTKEFIEILDAGFDAAEVATIPPGYDSVTIGDIERTRLNGVKVLFFVGVNDGIVPKASGHGGIISQYEREILKEQEIDLAPGAREQTFIQKFYLYLNMTKPSEKLYLSYSKLDAEGKSIRSSYLIGVMKNLFPKLDVNNYEDISKEINLSTREAAREYLIHGERDEKWYALAKYFAEDIEDILEASYIHYSDDPISKAAAKAIYGNNIDGSVTRFEKYAKCAYAHYLQYGLKLKEREILGFQSVDIGNIYHEALELYSKKLANSDKDWFSIGDEERDILASQSMEEAILGYNGIEAYDTAENKYRLSRMEHIFKQTVWALTKQVRKGKFVPDEFELSFSKLNRMDALHFDFDNNESLDLRGRIDRLDTCRNEDGRVFVKIIDYKSGSTSFDLLKLYQGLQLQLMVYMNVAVEKKKYNHEGKEVIPGGMLYYHIDDPIIEVNGELSEEEINDRIFKALKPDGLVNSEETVFRAMDENFEGKSDVIPVALKNDGNLSATSKVASTEEFEIISEFVNTTIDRTGREIYDGVISVNPIGGTSDSCTYCPYDSICKIKSKLPGFKNRNLKKMKKDEIFEKMETETALYKASLEVENNRKGD